MKTAKIEVRIDEETLAAVKKLAGEGEKTVIDMASELVRTGAFRRMAANKWARANKRTTAKKPGRKPRAVAVKAKGPTIRRGRKPRAEANGAVHPPQAAEAVSELLA